MLCVVAARKHCAHAIFGVLCECYMHCYVWIKPHTAFHLKHPLRRTVVVDVALVLRVMASEADRINSQIVRATIVRARIAASYEADLRRLDAEILELRRDHRRAFRLEHAAAQGRSRSPSLCPQDVGSPSQPPSEQGEPCDDALAAADASESECSDRKEDVAMSADGGDTPLHVPDAADASTSEFSDGKEGVINEQCEYMSPDYGDSPQHGPDGDAASDIHGGDKGSAVCTASVSVGGVSLQAVAVGADGLQADSIVPVLPVVPDDPVVAPPPQPITGRASRARPAVVRPRQDMWTREQYAATSVRPRTPYCNQCWRAAHKLGGGLTHTRNPANCFAPPVATDRRGNKRL